jgi:hypothetical protein
MTIIKKVTHSDINIRIRILKALSTYKPIGLFKHFVMFKVLRNLKQPNAISADDIWKFLDERYGLDKLDKKANIELEMKEFSYDDIL